VCGRPPSATCTTRRNHERTDLAEVSHVPFTWQNLLRAIHHRQPLVFDVGEVDPTMTIQAILREDVLRYRTSTGSRASFKTVFTDTSNFLRIEEGVHDEEEVHKQKWRKGSGQAVMNRLFKPDSKIYAAWELLKTLTGSYLKN
jgi:hypothetical protein